LDAATALAESIIFGGGDEGSGGNRLIPSAALLSSHRSLTLQAPLAPQASSPPPLRRSVCNPSEPCSAAARTSLLGAARRGPANRRVDAEMAPRASRSSVPSHHQNVCQLTWALVLLTVPSVDNMEFDTSSLKAEVIIYCTLKVTARGSLTRIERDCSLIGTVNQGSFLLL
jgi:hypothetical protein